MEAPNENSVAQVEWANRQIGGLEFRNSLEHVPRSYEAGANVALSAGEWSIAIGKGLNWLRDQPFSRRPAVFTSYVSSLIEEYSRSIDVLTKSLRVNPGDPMLTNNLAFALASNNQVHRAVAILKGMDYESKTDTSAITLAATHGLVLFRTGYPDRGRILYQLAMEKATQMGVQKYRLMAELYLSREELLAKTPVALITAAKALDRAAKVPDPEVRVIASQVGRLYETIKHRPGARKQSIG
jgi:hypothetical protein